VHRLWILSNIHSIIIRVNSTPNPPDARPSSRASLQLHSQRRIETFQPVLFRMNDKWHFGIVNLWRQVKGEPWAARIQYGAQPTEYGVFVYLGDGAIIPLRLDPRTDPPTLRPEFPRKANDTTKK
jgi:hypothetical protein